MCASKCRVCVGGVSVDFDGRRAGDGSPLFTLIYAIFIET